MSFVYLYTITCKNPKITEKYLGYTSDFAATKKYRSEEYDYGSNATSKLYTFVREHGGWSNWLLTILEGYDTRDEALIFKLSLFEKYKFDLNSDFSK